MSSSFLRVVVAAWWRQVDIPSLRVRHRRSSGNLRARKKSVDKR